MPPEPYDRLRDDADLARYEPDATAEPDFDLYAVWTSPTYTRITTETETQ